MNRLFIESSAVLCWLFNQERALAVVDHLNWAEEIFSSVLTLVEVKRALNRAESLKEITSKDLAVLRSNFYRVADEWRFLSISDEIIAEASRRFPIEPLRSLDAIHLATAVESSLLYSDIRILSYDDKINDNASAIGLILV